MNHSIDRRRWIVGTTIGSGLFAGRPQYGLASQSPQAPERREVIAVMKRAATYFVQHVATHGGYVYYYDLDLQRRWGEGEATRDQIWIQPPGTPTVGLALLSAYESTGESLFLDAAISAAEAVIYGQLQSGGWTNCIDFASDGERIARYRNGEDRNRRGKDNSSLDDAQTQTALLFLTAIDQALQWKHAAIHEACTYGYQQLLKAQFPCGAFPQVWTSTPWKVPSEVSSSSSGAHGRARFPDYDWRTENRVKEYWALYTLNDGVAKQTIDTLLFAYKVYQQDRLLKAAQSLGEFLLQAQMPHPQPGWCQQYHYSMQPAWARPFEPPAIASHETQTTIEALMALFEVEGDDRFLSPLEAALDYLDASQLPDGRLARYYELESNRPLYMERNGKQYLLTYDDRRLPKHYGWKIESRVEELRRRYRRSKRAHSDQDSVPDQPPTKPHASVITRIMTDLDSEGRWVSIATGERMVGQPRFPQGKPFISSEVFSRNLTLLAAWL